MTRTTHTKKLNGIPPGPAFSNLWENAMSNLSRRSLATSAAALPALAVPAVALLAFIVSETEGLSSPDHEVFYFDGDAETLPFVRSIERCVRALAVSHERPQTSRSAAGGLVRAGCHAKKRRAGGIGSR
jgi:hypothetical protein